MVSHRGLTSQHDSTIHLTWLFITNNPTLISEIKVILIPGLADHDAVIIEGDISPIVNKQKPRKIFYTRKQTGVVLKNLCKAFVSKFVT